MDHVTPTSYEGQRLAGIRMPQLDPHILRGTITKWLKMEGDPVRRGEPVLEVSSETVEGGVAIAFSDERALAEVPSPVTGVIHKILLPPAALVPIHTVVAEVLGDPAAEAAPEPGMATPTGAGGEPESHPPKAFPYLSARSAILDALRQNSHPHDDCAASRLLVASAELLFSEPRLASWSCAYGRAGFLVSPHDLSRRPFAKGFLCLWLKAGVARDWRCSLRISLVDEFDPEVSCGLGYGRILETAEPTDESLSGELYRLVGLLISHERTPG